MFHTKYCTDYDITWLETLIKGTLLLSIYEQLWVAWYGENSR